MNFPVPFKPMIFYLSSSKIERKKKELCKTENQTSTEKEEMKLRWKVKRKE